MLKNIIASYLRISVEDGHIGESESISGQRDLIADYIRTHQDLNGMEQLEFCDDGHSGTNFDRPAVQELLDKVKNGKVNCIIVKDFSRFGRNYIDVGDYLEQIFPFLKIRFISINDNYDSAVNKYPAGNVDIAFKTIYNDYYCKDISRKIKSAIAELRGSGKFLSSELFGYEKSKEDRYKLVIDEKAAVTVRRIFDLFLSGKNTSEIAVELNADGVLTPMAYKKAKGGKCNRKSINGGNTWLGSSMSKILKDIRYTGAVVHGKYQVLCVGSDKYRTLPSEQWQIHYNRHEPIISMEDFEKVQKRFTRKTGKRNLSDKTQYESPLLKVKTRCGYCGYAMTKRYRDTVEYFCQHKNYDSDIKCFSGKIYIEDIENTVLSAVQTLFAVYSEKTAAVVNNEQASSVDLVMEIQKLRKEIERLNNAKYIIYDRYSKEIITRQQYKDESDVITVKIERLSSQASDLENEYEESLKNTPPTALVDEVFNGISTIERLTPEIVSALIERIYIHDADRIEIKWKFNDTGDSVTNL